MGRILVIINLVLLNLGLGWLFYKSQIPVVAPTSTNSIEYVDQCGEECKKYIDSKIIIPTPSTFIKTVYQTTPKTKTRSVVYIPIPGSGFTTNNTWSDLPGTDFYFNKSDYLGIIDVAFEANLRLFNGNGTAYVQIFDVTHGVGVQGVIFPLVLKLLQQSFLALSAFGLAKTCIASKPNLSLQILQCSTVAA